MMNQMEIMVINKINAIDKGSDKNVNVDENYNTNTKFINPLGHWTPWIR